VPLRFFPTKGRNFGESSYIFQGRERAFFIISEGFLFESWFKFFPFRELRGNFVTNVGFQ